ncbi:MAG: diguanylate cyclase domain-containing protein [Massilia sp.]
MPGDRRVQPRPARYARRPPARHRGFVGADLVARRPGAGRRDGVPRRQPRAQAGSQVSWQAAHDALTGLVNRRTFETAVADALRSAKDEGHRHAMLYMDLDRFRIVNDSCGHGAGDVLLQTLARLLQDHMRESDMLARLGGDELGVLLPFCPLPRALRRADEIRGAVRDFRFLWNDRAFELGVSIGLVEIDADSKSMSELMIAADQACHMAKEQGRNGVHIYRESDAVNLT